VALALVGLKVEALAELLHHRVAVIVLFGLGLAFAVLRGRPVAIAVSAAALVPLAVDPRSLVVGIAVGVGVFVLLLALFLAIATVLHARQNRRAGVARVTRGPARSSSLTQSSRHRTRPRPSP
jgi:hypothetical protein